MQRIFLIVADSLGIGEMPDAGLYGDTGSNTLRSLYNTGKLNIPNMAKLGIFNIDGMDYAGGEDIPLGVFARMSESSFGKDTTVGHWEIAGIISNTPFPTYPGGFPYEIILPFEELTGKKVLCNKPYSGTEVIIDYGRQHEKTGDLIVYTSADSVFQIAAHEKIVPIDTLYEYCETAREILKGEHAVSRVIARPFEGEYPNYIRTVRRRDFSVPPPCDTMLDILKDRGYDVISVGKISDIFTGKGITESLKASTNEEGMIKTEELLNRSFNGLCFTNLVEFDSLYGHRNDAVGYTNALNGFDLWLGGFIKGLGDTDILMITGDHGCDPAYPGTDHTREYTPLIVYGKNITPLNLGTRKSFADIGKTILDIFSVEGNIAGESFFGSIGRD